MRWTSFLIIASLFISAGCGGSSDSKPIQGKMSSKMPGGEGTGVPSSPPGGGKGEKARSGKSKKGGGGGRGGRGGGGRGGRGGGGAPAEVKAQPVAIESGTVTLKPETSSISFYGGRNNSQRPGHNGGFQRFAGKISLDPTKKVQAISVEIETESIWTDAGRLTDHLKGSDFFEVKEFPKATFQSSKVTSGDGGKIDVQGSLTLHGVTKQISFAGKTTVSDDGLLLDAEFTIDRLAFDISYQPEQIAKDVKLTIAIGKKTQVSQGRGGRGGGRGGRGGKGGGRRDPGAMFDRQDTNKDGKLTGDEINRFLKPNLSKLDTDKDGAISQDEFIKNIRSVFGGRGGGKGGGRRGGGKGRGGSGGGKKK